MKFIFVCDLHSNKKLYEEVKKLVDRVKPDALIIGGDIFEYSPSPEPQLEFAREYLKEFIKSMKTPVYLIPGNCDRPNAVEYLYGMENQGLINILSLSGQIIKNVKFIGYEYINPTPLKIKDWEKRDLVDDRVKFDFPCLFSGSYGKLNLVENNCLDNLPSIEEELSKLYEEKSIWIMHAPPYGGVLDLNYNNVSCGSKAIRLAIERVKPIITLHGHIHEAPSMSKKWAEVIGQTISINPGSGDELNAVICDVDDDGKVISIKHNVYGELAL